MSSPNPTSSLTPGKRVGEYVLDQIVGRGAFGEVWRARHHVWTDQLVAIKLPTDPGYLRQLQREGFAAPQLVHPSIVRAIAFDPYATPPYLVMEYVPGTSLRPVVASRSLAAGDAVSILRVVLRALEHAHQQGIVHRDVKPENVLIHERTAREGYHAEGAVKLSDFGLGQTSRKLSAESIAMSMSVESEDAKKIAGTLDYMSPEQRAGEKLDGRADLYACGVMLFEMLTGEKPAGTELPSEINPALPRKLDEVFRSAHARLSKRFTSAGEMLAALDAVAPATSTPPPLPGRSVAVHPATSTARRDQCPACRGNLDPRDQFCIHCGTQVTAHVRRCNACGGYPSPEDRFCILCGSELSLPATSRV